MLVGAFIEFEHRNREYGYVYLERPHELPLEEEIGLLVQIADMDIDSVKRKNVKGDCFQGVAVDRGFHTIGGICGRWYDVQLESDFGNIKVGYMLRDLYAHLRN